MALQCSRTKTTAKDPSLNYFQMNTADPRQTPKKADRLLAAARLRRERDPIDISLLEPCPSQHELEETWAEEQRQELLASALAPSTDAELYYTTVVGVQLIHT
ncbi:hypothetical protein PROFUN_09864 [Planoprotostelium fungivorum]|uniref:Uncharacterized protein n=1 Tax=Planoprotostelium fungivorum TaxID=1890364 RepID=A0A2P6NGE2_9EUKA|nr:hypothetical protein PROFUN_09864 [Planoprotostelium fungivorum]